MVNFVAVISITGSQFTPKSTMVEKNDSRKMNVAVPLSPEVHNELSQFADAWGMALGDFLAMAALDRTMIERAINQGYEILGRNQQGEEIEYTEILYGDPEQFNSGIQPKLTLVKNQVAEVHRNEPAKVLKFKHKEK